MNWTDEDLVAFKSKYQDLIDKGFLFGQSFPKFANLEHVELILDLDQTNLLNFSDKKALKSLKIKLLTNHESDYNCEFDTLITCMQFSENGLQNLGITFSVLPKLKSTSLILQNTFNKDKILNYSVEIEKLSFCLNPKTGVKKKEEGKKSILDTLAN